MKNYKIQNLPKIFGFLLQKCQTYDGGRWSKGQICKCGWTGRNVTGWQVFCGQRGTTRSPGAPAAIYWRSRDVRFVQLWSVVVCNGLATSRDVRSGMSALLWPAITSWGVEAFPCQWFWVLREGWGEWLLGRGFTGRWFSVCPCSCLGLSKGVMEETAA